MTIFWRELRAGVKALLLWSMVVGGLLAVCVAPFLVPDAIKIALALLLTNRLKPHIK